MTQFITGQTVAQSDPVVVVDPSLPPGMHRFQLVVVDDSGNLSEPTFIEVIVQDNAKPTAVLDVVDANGRRLDPKVEAGKAFTLSGARSSDVAPGKVVEYRFTLLDRN